MKQKLKWWILKIEDKTAPTPIQITFIKAYNFRQILWLFAKVTWYKDLSILYCKEYDHNNGFHRKFMKRYKTNDRLRYTLNNLNKVI